MEPQRKAAYRHLLYWAMLDIRGISSWFEDRSWWFRLRTWRQGRDAVVRVGAVADWLHNLAVFSAHDFDGFREDWFWQEFDRLRRDYPDLDQWGYRAEFERVLNTPPESDGPRG